MTPSTRIGASLFLSAISTTWAIQPSAAAQFASRACRCAISQRQLGHLRKLTTTSRQWQQSTSTPSTPPADRAAANTERVQHELSPSDESNPARSLSDGIQDAPSILADDGNQVDWTRSYHGLSSVAFSPEQADVLQAPLDYDDIEIKPDGIVYLPEIKYRRILNKAFGPGGWGLAPRGETIVTAKVVTREYGLVCGGRLVSIARGEQQYFDPDGIPTATEGCKSNAMMRCCKDLGVASELWDPRFIKKFMAEMGKETIVEHQMTKKRRKHHMRKDDEVKYPFKEIGPAPSSTASASSASTSTPASAARSAYSARPAAATSTTKAAPKAATATSTKP